MGNTECRVDAIIIGGGFYGAAIAVYLVKERGLRHVVLIEKEARLLQRASHTNQARVHNGYHYPRSFTTAFRSRVNFPRFIQDWQHAISHDFTKLYAIARRNSKVTARQFEHFCHEIGASIKPAEPGLQKLFEPRLIEAVFEVQEYAFNTLRLADWARNELGSCGVNIRLSTRAVEIGRSGRNSLVVKIVDAAGNADAIESSYVFNCTYSGLNQFHGDFHGTTTKMKHEITEMALMKMPGILNEIGVTVMDGPYFSMMPFPSRELHTLSHVRYTPHKSWSDALQVDPYAVLKNYEKSTRVDRMVRDAARYLPSISNAEYVESLFEVKTILVKNEGDDGRPILFEKHADLPGCFSILGGKIDNIYDVLEKLSTEEFVTGLEK